MTQALDQARKLARGVGRRLPEPVRTRVRTLVGDRVLTDGEATAVDARRAEAWPEGARSPWTPLSEAEVMANAVCNICRWTGASFTGPAHSEGAECPQCGSIARDRFLLWCLQRRSPARLGARVLETSPRMGEGYRRAMGEWFDYLCSDFDLSAHKGMIQVDLQDIDLDDSSIDILLTPHVLEHVPETDKALGEIHRVLAPTGRMYLQVPVLQGSTAPPEQPEFHGDNTPVFWRFGYDLTRRLEGAGFEVSTLVTEEWHHLCHAGAKSWYEATSPEFDVDSMLSGVIPDDLEIVADVDESRRHGFEPAYMFITWECIKRG